MRTRALDPELIRSFLTAFELQNFTRAGEKLGLTQQTVSGQMRRLESIVGRSLFIRAGTSVQVTPEAEALAVYMRQVQKIAERVEAHFAAIPLDGPIRVGLLEGFTSEGLPALLAAMHQKRPNTKVYVEIGNSEQLIVRMQNKSLDLVLSAQRAGEAVGSILWSDRLHWVGDLESYRDPAVPIPLAVRPEPSVVRAMIIQALASVGRPFEIVFESDSLGSLRAAFDTGIGIGALAGTFIGIEPTAEESATFLPALGEIQYFLLMQSDPSPVVRAFNDLALEVAHQYIRRVPEGTVQPPSS